MHCELHVARLLGVLLMKLMENLISYVIILLHLTLHFAASKLCLSYMWAAGRKFEKIYLPDDR